MEVTIARGGTFTGPVYVSARSLPPGVYVGAGRIDAGATTTTLDLAVDATAELGTKTIVVSAVGDEIKAATATLVISAVAPSGAVTLAAEPNPLTVAVGAPATATIILTRTAPFTGAVDLTVTSVTGGVTATLSPAIATGASATLSIAAAPGAVNGTYSLQVRGTGTGIADSTTTLSFAITGGVDPVTLNPSSVEVTAGGPRATSDLTCNICGTDGSVRLFVSGAPTGLTTSYAPVSWDRATVSVQAGAAVAPGTYILSVTAFQLRRGERMPRRLGVVMLPVVVSAAPALRQ